MKVVILVLVLAGFALGKNKHQEVKQYDHIGVQLFQIVNTSDADYQQSFGDGKGGTDTVSCYGNECSQNPSGSTVLHLDDGRLVGFVRNVDDSVLIGDPLMELGRSTPTSRVKHGPQERKGRFDYMFKGRFKYRLVMIGYCQCEGIALALPVRGKNGEIKKYTEAVYTLAIYSNKPAEGIPEWPELP